MSKRKTVYQLDSRDDDGGFLVRASSPARAWAWLAKNEGVSVRYIKAAFEIRKAEVNEAK